MTSTDDMKQVPPARRGEPAVPSAPTHTDGRERDGMTAPVGQEVGLGDPAPSWRDAALVPTLVSVAALVAIMNSLGAPLIPTIASHDHVSLSTGQWLLTAALLTGALATPVMGRLADGPRQRQVILVALVVVLAGCVLAALSKSFLVVAA